MSVTRVPARNLADEAMQPMASPGIAPKHEGTLAWHYLSVVLTAELDCLRADRALSSCSVHPDPANSGVGTILHNRIRHSGGSLPVDA